MADYIEREALLLYLNDIWLTMTPTDFMPDDDRQLAIVRCMGLNDAMDAVKGAPAADVVPVRHGKWIDRPSKRGYGLSTYCSCCGQHSGIGGIESNRHRAYCPNCGAKMDLKDGDGNV